MATHTLKFAGTPYSAAGKAIFEDTSVSAGPGRALCSCGELSPKFQSGNARRQWHRDHKAMHLAEDDFNAAPVKKLKKPKTPELVVPPVAEELEFVWDIGDAPDSEAPVTPAEPAESVEVLQGEPKRGPGAPIKAVRDTTPPEVAPTADANGNPAYELTVHYAAGAMHFFKAMGLGATVIAEALEVESYMHGLSQTMVLIGSSASRLASAENAIQAAWTAVYPELVKYRREDPEFTAMPKATRAERKDRYIEEQLFIKEYLSGFAAALKGVEESQTFSFRTAPYTDGWYAGITYHNN